MIELDVAPTEHTGLSILTPEILAEESMLIQFRIKILEEEARSTLHPMMLNDIDERIGAHCRMLTTVRLWWEELRPQG